MISQEYWNKTAKLPILRFFRNLIAKANIENWELNLASSKILWIFDERFFNLHELIWLWLINEEQKDYINENLWNWEFKLIEKLDWSLLNIFKDKENDIIIISSKSTLTFSWQENNISMWVWDQVQNWLKNKWLTKEKVIDSLKLDDYWYSFEAIYSKRVVEVEYSEGEQWLYPILIRDIETLKEIAFEDYLNEINRLNKENWEIFKKPRIYQWESLKNLFDQLAKKWLNLNNFEWLVIYNAN